MERLKTLVTPAVAAVLVAGAVCFTAIVIWAPPETKQWLLGANGLFWTATSFVTRILLDDGERP